MIRPSTGYWARVVILTAFATSASCNQQGAVFRREPAPTPTVDGPVQTLMVGWLGNSLPPSNRWMQSSVAALWAAGDGTVFLNSIDEPNGLVAGIYKQGAAIGQLGDLAVEGRKGAGVITGNARFVYAGIRQEQHATSAAPPPPYPWHPLRRYHHDGSPAPFPAGGGHDQSMLLLPTEAPLSGACANDDNIYVVIGEGRVFEVDATTMALKRDWQLDRGGACAIERDGLTLWVGRKTDVQGSGGELVALTLSTGRTRIVAIPAIPTALAFDRQGRLLVGLADPSATIVALHVNAGASAVAPYLGEPGGIWGPPQGAVSERRFAGIVGLAVDDGGTVYVAMNNGLPDGQGAAVIRAFSDAQELSWRLEGLVNDQGAFADPASDGFDVYTQRARFGMTFDSDAISWRWVGWSIDGGRVPTDMRLGTIWGAPLLRTIQGRRFLMNVGIGDGRGADHLGIYSLGRYGETALPRVVFGSPGTQFSRTLPGRPARGLSWVWSDLDGDMALEANEYDAFEWPRPWGWWVDENGSVWTCSPSGGVAMVPLLGFRDDGLPLYDSASMVKLGTPKPMTGATRLQYDPATDAMYLAGYTNDGVPANDQGEMGAFLLRYDRWSSQSPAVRFQIELPRDARPTAFSVDAGRVFVSFQESSDISVYDSDDGHPVATLSPGPKLAGVEGGSRLSHGGVRALRRRNGEYLILAANGRTGRITVYRMPPQWNDHPPRASNP